MRRYPTEQSDHEPQRPHPADRVLAILVVHGDQPWHAVVASQLAEHRRERRAPRLLVVDNGGAPSAPSIAQELDAPLVEMPRPRSFGAAVAAGVNHPLAQDAEFILLLHDDLVLDPEAVDAMVDAMDRRPDVAVTGPKLLEWKPEPTLQQVGMTIDAFGRAESHLHRAEVDQGQHDHRGETLYVSTAGMLIRRRVFLALGGFDPRFAAMRDDLDLCWRAWLAGYRVEVVPEAVGWHIAAAGRSVRRRGAGRRATTRYFAERHTLAAMIKNLGIVRLAWTLPLYGLLALAKVFGFLLTRRVSSAAAPLAAMAWNVRSLPGTLRLRRMAQANRQRSDAELRDLFAHGAWRRRAYAEALAEWARGTHTTPLVRDEVDSGSASRSDESSASRSGAVLRDHPAAVIGSALLMIWLVANVSLLGSGPLIGGQVAAWPDRAVEFLSGYAAGWGSGPSASGALPSPIQAVLGVLGLAVGGGAWLAQRLVIVGLVPLIWLTGLRAGRLITPRPAPRVIGATLYAVSPLVLGAYAAGRLDALAVAAALPAVSLLTARATYAGVSRGRAWRATAILAVVATMTLSVAPDAWPVLALLVAGVAALAVITHRARPAVLWRLVVATLAALALVLPWWVGLRSAAIASTSGFAEASQNAMTLPMWEALVAYVPLMPGVGGVAGWIWIAAAAAVVLAALVFGLPNRPGTVLLLLGTMVAFAGAAALLSRQGATMGPQTLWPVTVALPSMLALAGLAVTAARSAPEVLRRHGFGLRHVIAATVGVTVVAGATAMLTTAVRLGEWPQVHRDPQTVPLFVEADAQRLGDYRVLLLQGDETQMNWDVTEPDGPKMTAFGAGTSREMHQALDDVVAGLLAGDRRAAGRAGVLNVRYVVLRDNATRDAVAPALADLAAVEPLAAGGGSVYEFRTWLPRAAVISEDTLDQALAGRPLPADAIEQTALEGVAVDRYLGGPTQGGIVLLSEATDTSWSAAADGRPLESISPTAGELPINAFALPDESEGVRVTATSETRPWWLVWQAAVLLALLSLALRAPGRAAHDEPVAVPGRRRNIWDIDGIGGVRDPDHPGPAGHAGESGHPGHDAATGPRASAVT